MVQFFTNFGIKIWSFTTPCRHQAVTFLTVFERKYLLKIIINFSTTFHHLINTFLATLLIVVGVVTELVAKAKLRKKTQKKIVCQNKMITFAVVMINDK